MDWVGWSAVKCQREVANYLTASFLLWFTQMWEYTLPASKHLYLGTLTKYRNHTSLGGVHVIILRRQQHNDFFYNTKFRMSVSQPLLPTFYASFVSFAWSVCCLTDWLALTQLGERVEDWSKANQPTDRCPGVRAEHSLGRCRRRRIPKQGTR